MGGDKWRGVVISVRKIDVVISVRKIDVVSFVIFFEASFEKDRANKGIPSLFVQIRTYHPFFEKRTSNLNILIHSTEIGCKQFLPWILYFHR